jgi:hypothetical protein
MVDHAELCRNLQPPGTVSYNDALEAAKAMHLDMVSLECQSAEARRSYGNLAGCAKSIMAAIELIQSRYGDLAFHTLVAPFLPSLAEMLLAFRGPAK